MFPKLNLPEYSFKIKKEKDAFRIYDSFRRKYIVLTPEEWVRQNLLAYLTSEKKFPESLIRVESGLSYNRLKKRYDVLIYKGPEPCLLVECKATGIKIDQAVFEQAAIYNQTIKAGYILVSNGLQHFCCKMDYLKNAFTFLKEIPCFDEL